MFAYCRNNPVCRIDATGNVDASSIDDENDKDLFPDDDIGYAGDSPNNGGRTYTPTQGGGGETSRVQTGNIDVTFGHGGRHINGDISKIESFIADDVVTRPSSTRSSTSVLLNYQGNMLEYRYFTLSPTHIHVGTYFFVTKAF